MARSYRKAKRAESQEATREKIVEATLSLHLEQGVATTSYLDVAERAGVGAATVYRHFPTMSSLVDACGAHVRQRIAPPRPEDAAGVFAGLRSRNARAEGLARELDSFYRRGAAALWSAEQDRHRFPELDAFLQKVDASVAALVAAALGGNAPKRVTRAVRALSDFAVWRALTRQGIEGDDLIRLQGALIERAITESERA